MIYEKGRSLPLPLEPIKKAGDVKEFSLDFTKTLSSQDILTITYAVPTGLTLSGQLESSKIATFYIQGDSIGEYTFTAKMIGNGAIPVIETPKFIIEVLS